MMHPCSSEGSHTTLNTKLLAIHLAAEDFPDFLAGCGGVLGWGLLKQGCVQMFCWAKAPCLLQVQGASELGTNPLHFTHG